MGTRNRDVKQQLQQGDVILQRLHRLPDGEVKILATKRCTVARGEATGHHHTVEDDEAELIQIGGRMLLKLGKTATLTHQEHASLTLEPGIWEVGQVQEHDWLNDMTRRVTD